LGAVACPGGGGALLEEPDAEVRGTADRLAVGHEVQALFRGAYVVERRCCIGDLVLGRNASALPPPAGDVLVVLRAPSGLGPGEDRLGLRVCDDARGEVRM